MYLQSQTSKSTLLALEQIQTTNKNSLSKHNDVKFDAQVEN